MYLRVRGQRSCICVLELSVLLLSMIFPKVWYFLLLHFIPNTIAEVIIAVIVFLDISV